MQPLQHPHQDAGTLLGQLFDEEGIIHPGRVTVFHRDEDLSAPCLLYTSTLPVILKVTCLNIDEPEEDAEE